MKTLKHAAMTLAVACVLSAPVHAVEATESSSHGQKYATNFSQEDMKLLFGSSGQPAQVIVLSSSEMEATKGAVLWFNPVTINLARAGIPYMVRFAHHAAHHTFGRLGCLPHLQANIWRPGVSGSGRAVRVPLPNRPFFRP